jgi:hypothetical protein
MILFNVSVRIYVISEPITYPGCTWEAADMKLASPHKHSRTTSVDKKSSLISLSMPKALSGYEKESKKFSNS